MSQEFTFEYEFKGSKISVSRKYLYTQVYYNIILNVIWNILSINMWIHT